MNFSQSTFNCITRVNIKFHLCKVLCRQKMNIHLILKMVKFLSIKYKSWYQYLSVSAEAWFSLDGHVLTEKYCFLLPSGSRNI